MATATASSNGALRVLGHAEAPPAPQQARAAGTTPIGSLRRHVFSAARRNPSNCNGANPIERHNLNGSASIVAALSPHQESSSSSSIGASLAAFEIRKATPRDANALSDLYSETYNEALPRHYSEQELAEAMPTLTTPSPRMLASGGYYVAFQRRSRDVDGDRAHDDEEMLLGAGAWEPDDTNYADQAGRDAVISELAHIRHFATKPSFTGRGIGKALMAACMLEAATQGISQMECISSFGAVSFYTAFGFSSVENTAHRYASGLAFGGVRMRCGDLATALNGLDHK